MTRAYYLEMRKGDPLFIVYEYYKENFDSGKHNYFLRIEEFVQFFFMWSGARKAINDVLKYYDNKFTIVTLTDKEGEIIGIL